MSILTPPTVVQQVNTGHSVKKLALQHENKPRNPSAQDLKLQWEIHFLTFFNTDQNASIFFRIVIWTFLYQICFLYQFLTLGSGQTENTQIRVFAHFQFDQFPKLKINFESRFEIRISILLFFKKIGAFRSVFIKVKKWIFPL